MSTTTTIPTFAFSSPEEWSDFSSDEWYLLSDGGRRYHYSSVPFASGLQKVLVRASAELLVNAKTIVKSGSAVCTLPRNNEDVVIASHICKKGVTIAHLECIVLDINIYLPRNTQNAPNDPATTVTPIQNPSHSALILQTLNGHNIVDTAFILPTGTGVKVVYGISSLLRGNSATLDSILEGRVHDGSIVGWDYDDDGDYEDDSQTGLGLTGMGSVSGSDASASSVATVDEDLPDVPLAADAVHEIADVAYKTWRGMMQFIYTGTVAFAQVGDRSSENPSPKSMYRLADSLGIPQLKEKALSAIQEQLNTQNVVQEAFSVFTSRYPEVLDVEIAFLKENASDAAVKKQLNALIEDVVDGRMPHAKGAFKMLISIVDDS